MKDKKLFFLTLFFFLIINTAFWWEAFTGSWLIVAHVALIILFLFLVFHLFRQMRSLVHEDFASRKSIPLILLMSIVLGLTIYRPAGLINDDLLYGKTLLFASREGAANCNTTFKLKKDRFTEEIICFGEEKITGHYIIKNDTIFFTNVQADRGKVYYEFALIKKADHQNKKILGELVRYSSLTDTTPHILWITSNKLTENDN